MANTKFELNDQQQERMNSWFKHHWDVVHKGWRPPDTSGYAGKFLFGPTGCGCNVSYECAWCVDNSPNHKINLTFDEDDGEFIFKYDENWIRLPASWEKNK